MRYCEKNSISLANYCSTAAMGIGSGEQGGLAPQIFIHGTDIVDRILIVLFFGIFLLFFGIFSVPPPGNFSVDALDSSNYVISAANYRPKECIDDFLIFTQLPQSI